MYCLEEFENQRPFLDTFLKGHDDKGWIVPRVKSKLGDWAGEANSAPSRSQHRYWPIVEHNIVQVSMSLKSYDGSTLWKWMSSLLPDIIMSALQPVEQVKVYTVAIELWPTTVVIEKGARLVLEIAASDSPVNGTHPPVGLWTYDDPRDRPGERFKELNIIHIGDRHENWLVIPVIPQDLAWQLGEGDV
ncbi:hypothetical protein BJ170DRAFT_595748 [Xylariales sp. AK1849]|nr:hypothetical protein BJ170DRAFT_595748 [Xylariales sp. AK1849]